MSNKDDRGAMNNKDDDALLLGAIRDAYRAWAERGYEQKQDEMLLQLLIWEAKDRGMVITSQMIKRPQ